MEPKTDIYSAEQNQMRSILLAFECFNNFKTLSRVHLGETPIHAIHAILKRKIEKILYLARTLESEVMHKDGKYRDFANMVRSSLENMEEEIESSIQRTLRISSAQKKLKADIRTSIDLIDEAYGDTESLSLSGASEQKNSDEEDF